MAVEPIDIYRAELAILGADRHTSAEPIISLLKVLAGDIAVNRPLSTARPEALSKGQLKAHVRYCQPLS